MQAIDLLVWKMIYVGVFLISFLNTFADPYAIKSSAYLKYIFFNFNLLNSVFTFYMPSIILSFTTHIQLILTKSS